MAKKRGRPKQCGPRYPSGKLKPLSVVAQLEAAEREREEAEMSTVLAQPHRCGNRSQWAENALGRFCLRHKLREELYDAGHAYGGLRRKWASVWGARVDGLEGGGGGDVPMELARSWRNEIDALQGAVLSAAELVGFPERAPMALLGIDHLAVDGFDTPAICNSGDIISGLMALAVAMRKLDFKDLRIAV